MITYINDEMRESLDLENPYSLVVDGKWTFDVMRKYMKTAANLNGDDSFQYSSEGNSIYGLATFDQGEFSLLLGGDITLFGNDSDDRFVCFPQYERFVSYFQKLVENLSVAGDYINYNRTSDDNFETIFKNNRALMMIGEIKAASLLRNMDADFSILPMAKADETQENYRNMLSVGYLACIPTSCDTPEISAAILDAMAFETYQNVLPLFYHERVSQKELRNEESIELLSIIHATRCIDIGYIFGWNSSIFDMLTASIAKGSTDIASKAESEKARIEDLIEKTMRTVEEQQ